ncbi:protein virilizer homolog [Glandiceps talaboti]
MADHGERDMAEINLLFCETFSHDHGEELNLDLVQFPRPVCISEVRIIPPGAKAHADFQEDSKLGKTSPGDFRLELFINNLSNPGSAVFERLGTLEYHETTDIQLVTNSKIPTDGVILRGIYSSITIAIYGVLTTVSKPADDRPPSPPPPPPPPQPVSKGFRTPVTETKSQDTEYISERQRERERRDYESDRARRQKYDERYSSEQRSDDIDRSRGGTRQSKPMSPPGPPPEESQGPRTPPPRKGPRTPPGTPKTDSSPEPLNLHLDDDIHEPGEIPEETEGLDRAVDLFEDLTPEHSPNPAGVSDGEINEGVGSLLGEEETEGYETISDDDESSIPEIFVPFQAEEPWMYVSSFNPFQCEISTPLSFPPPDQSVYEREKIKAKSQDEETIPESANKIKEFVNTFKTDEHTSKWVSALEELPNLLNSGLAYVDDSCVQVLVDWVIEALDLDTAIAQSIAVNIRQIKAGVKLTSALCDCGPTVANKLIEGSVQEQLFSLLFDDHMASSLRLMILQALDSCTNCSEGMERFLGRHQQSQDQVSGYQRALKLMLSDQTVRVVTAVSALLKKAHVYEALGRLKHAAECIMENTPPLPEGTKETEHKEESGERSPDKMIFIETSEKSSAANTPERSEQGLLMEADMPMTSPTGVCTASTQDVETILECLAELCYVLHNASHTIVQPPIKAFPTTARITGPTSTVDPYPVLFHMFNARRLLESLLLLVSCPATSGHLEIFDSVREIIQLCMKTQQGLLYLAYNHATVKVLIQTLTNNYGEDNIEEGSLHQLGLQLIYHLQALQNIDQLKDLLSSKKTLLQSDRDNADVISTLHNMYAMTLHPYALIGKSAVAHVFNLDSNLDSLLPFLELTADEDVDHNIKKSASYGYASGLLSLIIQYCDNIETFKTYAPKIHALCPEHSELSNWLSPSEGLKFDISSITPLVEYMKNHTSELSSNLPIVGPAFVTAVRILRYLTCPRHEYDNSAEHQKDLHYNLAVIQLFSAEAMEVFISVFKKLGDFLLRPWQEGFPQPSSVNHIIESIVTPLLIVTRRMLTELLSSTKAEFRDVRLVSCMLTLHTVLCSPTSSILSSDTARVQSLILDVLLTFTKPALKSDTEEAVTNSAWTMMLKQVLEYIPSAPYTFMSGLSLLLELLPLPLPMQVQEALTADEVQQALNTRKLWSIHLHSLGPKIQNVINDLAGTGYHPLQHILRRVCWQLADLATPTALLVVRYVFELLHNELNKASTKEDTKEDSKTLEVVGGQANRVLMLLMYLVSQPPVKAPLLHLLRSNVKTDERFAEALSRLLNLLNTVSESPTHLQSQECIVAIVQSICDPEVTLLSTEATSPLPEQLANSLPTKEHLEQIIIALLEHIGNMEQSYATVLLCLRTLIMLTEHDYTFYHLRCALEKNINAFFNLFRKLASTFNKDSADCLSTLSTFLELLQLLLSPENIDDDHHSVTATVRTFTITETHLMTLLRWSNNQSDNHPIKELEKQLMDCCKEDEAMGTLLLEITNLSQVLNSTQDFSASKPEESIEPTLPAPDSLSSQFNNRACYLVGDIEDDRINYWLTIPPLDDPDIDMDMVKVDFEELSEKCCPDFDLKEEIAKGFAGEDSASPRKKMRLGKRKFDPLIARSERKGMGQMRRGHKGMPGRGGRPGFYQGGRPNDLFRQRAQNTSRPPSMHVDDFEALEHQPQQQHHMPPMKKMCKGPPLGRPSRGFFGGGGGPGYQRGGFPGGPGARWSGPGGGYNRRDLGPAMGNMQGRVPNMMGNRQQQTSPGGYQGRTSRGFLSRRPDNRLSAGQGYGRPLPPPQGRQDGLYGSPGRGGPRGGMRGSPSSGRGMPSPTRKPYRGFRGGMPSGGRWVGPGGKTDPHTRFIPPKPTRGGYGRHDGGSRHGGGRPFSR